MSRPDATPRAVVLRADDDPRPGIERPSTHQRYRNPTVAVEERPLGSLQAADLRVRMLYVGVCGSDLHLAQADDAGYVASSVPAVIGPEGRVLGHEGVGVVMATGTDVTSVASGEIVTFASIVACGHCDACRRGAPNQCRTSELIGAQRDGLFASVVDVPAALAVPVTGAIRSGADLQALTCTEPAANALVACTQARVTAADSVVIFGAGPIGLFCAMLCRLHHAARRVIVVEPVAARRRTAAKWSDDVFDVEGFFRDGDQELDVVLEASGDLSNVNRALRRLGPQGRIVLLGRSGEPLVLDDVDRLISQAISVSGSRGHLGGAVDDVLRSYADGTLPLGDVVTGVLDSLDDLAALLSSDQSAMADHAKLLVKVGDLDAVFSGTAPPARS